MPPAYDVSLNKLDEKLDEVKDTLGAMQADIAVLKNQNAMLLNQQGTHEKRISDLEKQVAVVETRAETRSKIGVAGSAGIGGLIVAAREAWRMIQ